MKTYQMNLVDLDCPLPLTKLKELLDEMASGDTVVAEISSSYAMKNIIDWIGKMGYQFSVEELGDETWQLTIVKAPPN